ncbi:hypothetical protein [Massilia eburnea]|uniref:hypothetical protein n=1 Tax=Massilia eburnea TaxID=1776165 RepID=UPI0014781D49|nr:hypothetical protein [Massilia eburnea]
MKLITASILLLLLPGARADEILVPVSIIPNTQWVYWQARSVKCAKRVDVPFRMDAIGSKARFKAHADVCGDFAEAQVTELLRLVKLADAAAKYNQPWRVSITGNEHAVSISLIVPYACNGGTDWLVGRKFGRWAIWEPLLDTRFLCPRDFQPVILP